MSLYCASTFPFDKYGKQLIESPCHLKLQRKIYYELYFIIHPASKDIFMWFDSWACIHVGLAGILHPRPPPTQSFGRYFIYDSYSVPRYYFSVRWDGMNGVSSSLFMEVRFTVCLTHKSWSFINKTLQSLRSFQVLEKCETNTVKARARDPQEKRNQNGGWSDGTLYHRDCSESLNVRKSFLIIREKFKTNHRIRTLFSVI